MTLERGDVERFAERLHRAERRREPTEPLTDERPDLTDEDAYEIQAALLRRRLVEGEEVVGAKLGFTSRAMHEALGVDRPNHGWLTDRMLLDDGVVGPDELIHPKVEPEIGFLLRRDLGGAPVTVGDVLDATAAVFPCLEVVDSRYRGFRFQGPDNTADNSSAARVVVGAAIGRPDRVDLARVGVVSSVDGVPVATGAGAAAAGHPVAAVAWLARRLAARGAALPRGSIVISGGLTAPVDLRLGTVVRASFAALGAVSVRMEG